MLIFLALRGFLLSGFLYTVISIDLKTRQCFVLSLDFNFFDATQVFVDGDSVVEELPVLFKFTCVVGYGCAQFVECVGSFGGCEALVAGGGYERVDAVFLLLDG